MLDTAGHLDSSSGTSGMLDTAGRLHSSSGTVGTQPLIVTSLTKATDTNDLDYF